MVCIKIFFTFNFYIAHWQHVDLLCSGPRNKETFDPLFTHYTEAVTKEEFWLSRFHVCKTSVKGSCFSKVAGYFPKNFVKSNTGNNRYFLGFYLDFIPFLLYAIFP